MALGDTNKIGEAFVQVRYSLDGLNQSLGQMRSTVRGQIDETSRRAEAQLSQMRQSITRHMTGIAAALGVGLSVRSVQQAADAWSDMSSRVGIAVGNMELAPTVMGRIQRIARTTYSSLEQTAEAFARNASTIRELGRSSNEALDFTAALNNALVVSGAKGQRAATVQEALSRALAGGALRGQELNTVLQSGGRVAQALADGLGVTTLELRALGAAGALTSERVIEALISQMQRLEEEAESMPATIEDGVQLIRNAFTAYIGEADKAAGFSERIAEALIMVADNMNIVAGIAAGVATLGLIKLAAAAGTAATAIRVLTIALAANPLGLIAVGVATAIGALVAFRDETIKVMGVTIRVGGVLSAVWTTISESIQGTTRWVYRLLQALGQLATFDFAAAGASVAAAGQALRESGQAIVDSWRDAFSERIEEVDESLAGQLDAIRERLASSLDLGGLVSGADAAAAQVRTIADEIRDVRFETMLVGLDDAGAAALRTARALGLVRDIAGDLDAADATKLFAVESGASEDVLRLQRALQGLSEAQERVSAAATKAAELDQRAIGVRESLRTEAERYAIELNRLDELYQSGRISAQEFAAAMDLLNKQFEKVPSAATHFERLQESIEKLAEQMSDIRAQGNDAMLGFAQGIADYALEAGNAYEQMRRMGEKAMKGLEDAIVDLAVTGKLEVKEMVRSILADLARLAIRQSLAQFLSIGLSALGPALAGAGGGPATTQAFASGGRFKVSGTGGVDSRLVQFKATPGEVVEVFKGSREYRESMGQGGADGRSGDSFSIAIDARGADAGVEMRIESAVRRAVQQAKAATRDEAMRSARYAGAF